MGPVGQALQMLQLTCDQRDGIREIVGVHVEGGLGTAVQAFHEAQRGLELAVWNPDAGQQELIDASMNVAQQSEQLVLLRHELVLELLGVLTDEQRATLFEMLAAGPQRPGGPEGPGGPGGPGGPESSEAPLAPQDPGDRFRRGGPAR
jgi:hypothetical protein